MSFRRRVLFSSSEFFSKKIRIAKNFSSAKLDAENHDANDLLSIKSKKKSSQQTVKNKISDSTNFDHDITQEIAKIALKIA